MGETEIKNARIDSISLGFCCGGAFGYNIGFYYGGVHQGLGSGLLEGATGGIIKRILEVAGVEDWKDLVGTYVRVESSYIKVHRMGNIIKDEWVDFNTIWDEVLDEAEVNIAKIRKTEA
jgi:hypothetical protein